MEQKFSDVYRTSFLTLDRYLQQSNTAQFYFRPLLPPLNTVSGEFYSLSPAQGTDPSIRINEYSSNGSLVGFGYLYDTSLNTPPNYWTLAGSNIYNNNPGFVGVGTTTPAAVFDVSGNTRIHGPALSNLLFVGDASLNNPSAEQDTVKIGTAGIGGRLVLGDDGKGVMRMLNAFGDSYIEAGTNMAVGSTGRLVFASMFDASGKPTMTVNTGTDEVLISNRFIDPLIGGYKLTVDGSANIGGVLTVSSGIANFGTLLNLGDINARSNTLRVTNTKVGINNASPTSALDVIGAVTATGTIASSVTTASRVYSDVSNIPAAPPAAFVSTCSFSANVSSLPYSVYLVTVEGCVDVDESTGTTALCTVDINNNSTPHVTREHVLSCSVTGAETVSVGSAFTTTAPIDRGTGTLIVNITLSNCVFAAPSKVYLTAVGLC